LLEETFGKSAEYMKTCPVIATVWLVSAIKEAHVNPPKQGARQIGRNT